MSEPKIVQKEGAKLSATTRKQIGRVGSEQREEMPSHVFLLPGARKFPVKVKQDGKWVYSGKLLRAAAARARMMGKDALAARADAIRERLLGKDKKEEARMRMASEIVSEIAESTRSG